MVCHGVPDGYRSTSVDGEMPIDGRSQEFPHGVATSHRPRSLADGESAEDPSDDGGKVGEW